jgi:hypothetical protein
MLKSSWFRYLLQTILVWCSATHKAISLDPKPHTVYIFRSEVEVCSKHRNSWEYFDMNKLCFRRCVHNPPSISHRPFTVQVQDYLFPDTTFWWSKFTAAGTEYFTWNLLKIVEGKKLLKHFLGTPPVDLVTEYYLHQWNLNQQGDV